MRVGAWVRVCGCGWCFENFDSWSLHIQNSATQIDSYGVLSVFLSLSEHSLTARADLDVGRVSLRPAEVEAVGVEGVLVVEGGEVQPAGALPEGEGPALAAPLHRAAAPPGALALPPGRRPRHVAAGAAPVLDGRVHVRLEPALTCAGTEGHGQGMAVSTYGWNQH